MKKLTRKELKDAKGGHGLPPTNCYCTPNVDGPQPLGCYITAGGNCNSNEAWLCCYYN